MAALKVEWHIDGVQGWAGGEPPKNGLQMATIDVFSVSIVMPLPVCHINGIIHYVAF